MGEVEVIDSTATFVPDGSMAATLANNFTVTTGLAACVYAPTTGDLTATVGPDGSVSGTVSITGYGGATCGETSYDAEFSG